MPLFEVNNNCPIVLTGQKKKLFAVFRLFIDDKMGEDLEKTTFPVDRTLLRVGESANVIDSPRFRIMEISTVRILYNNLIYIMTKATVDKAVAPSTA